MVTLRDSQSDLLEYPLPHQPVVTDFTLDDIKEVCLKSIPQWTNLNKDDIKVRRFTGGTFNYVFKVSTRIPNELNEVVFRFFDDSLSFLVDRELEKRVFRTSGEVGVGPKEIALFEISTRKGRVEEFFTGENLLYDQYFDREVCLLVSKELARFHRLNTPRFSDLSKKPELQRYFEDWLDYCVKFPRHKKSFEEKVLREEVKEYVELLHKKVATGRFAFKSILSHNDIHLFNLLYDQEKKTLRLLDFEMTAFNYAGYDLASYLCEAVIDYRNPARVPFLTVHTYVDFPEDTALEMAKAYLDESGVGYDDNFVRQFLDDVKFIQVGWWLARVLFNCIISIAVNREQRIQCLVIYAKLCHDTYRVKRQDAIDSGNWYE